MRYISRVALASQYSARHYFLLLLMAVALPLSKALVSVLLVLLPLHFFVSSGRRQRLKLACQSRGVIVFMLIFFVQLLSLIYSREVLRGLDVLVRMLPLLILPLVIAGSPSLSRREHKAILFVFVVGVLVNSFIASGIYWVKQSDPAFDIRHVSIFLSHIRLSLMVVFALCIAGYYAVKSVGGWRWAWLLAFIWLAFFLFLLRSLTGLVIATVLAFSVMLFFSVKIRHTLGRFSFLVASLCFLLFVASYFSHAWSRYFTTHPVNLQTLDSLTFNGCRYQHDTTNLMRENGYYVGLYLAEDEVRQAWNRRSIYLYDGRDRKGQSLSNTLHRYLTAKGLRKDSVGVVNLSEKEIRQIEAGIANPVLARRGTLYARIYQVLWEYEMYKNTDYINASSALQRWEFLKNGWFVLCRNPIFGVGVGDVHQSLQEAYQLRQTSLDSQYWLQCHNQWLTLALAVGMVGLALFFVAIVLPVWWQRSYRYFLFNSFMGIILLSFLSDDTLQTHMGINFFCFFYAFFVFGKIRGKSIGGASPDN